MWTWSIQQPAQQTPFNMYGRHQPHCCFIQQHAAGFGAHLELFFHAVVFSGPDVHVSVRCLVEVVAGARCSG